MRRGIGGNPNENPGVRPVERIELPERTSRKRLILVAVLVAVAILAFTIFLSGLFGSEDGWTQIGTNDTSTDTVADRLIFYYELGVSGTSANAEYRALTELYTQACQEAYTLFHAEEGFDGVNNLHTLNTHIGEEITVSDELYRVLAAIDASGSRFLYAAPYFPAYRNLFLMTEDVFATEHDPRKNPELAAYYAELGAYVGSDEHVQLELLGNGRVRLSVSDAYRAFAAEQGIDRYIDLYPFEGAFTLDYVADRLKDAGYVYGYISSTDGYIRNLDPRDNGYSLNLYTRHEGKSYGAARLDYTGQMAMVSLRAFPVSEQDEVYYTYADGEVCHPYVDPCDGLGRTACSAMVGYGKDTGCAALLLAMLPLYITDTPDTAAVSAAAGNGMDFILSGGTSLLCTDPDAAVTVFEFSGITFRKVGI